MEAVTHYVTMDKRPNAEGLAMAVCGAMIPEKQTTALPTCDACAAYWDLLLRSVGIR